MQFFALASVLCRAGEVRYKMISQFPNISTFQIDSSTGWISVGNRVSSRSLHDRYNVTIGAIHLSEFF